MEIIGVIYATEMTDVNGQNTEYRATFVMVIFGGLFGSVVTNVTNPGISHQMK